MAKAAVLLQQQQRRGALADLQLSALQRGCPDSPPVTLLAAFGTLCWTLWYSRGAPLLTPPLDEQIFVGRSMSFQATGVQSDILNM